MDKIKLINYGNFVKRRNGSIQVDFKFDQKPLGKGRKKIFINNC